MNGLTGIAPARRTPAQIFSRRKAVSAACAVKTTGSRSVWSAAGCRASSATVEPARERDLVLAGARAAAVAADVVPAVLHHQRPPRPRAGELLRTVGQVRVLDRRLTRDLPPLAELPRERVHVG